MPVEASESRADLITEQVGGHGSISVMMEGRKGGGKEKDGKAVGGEEEEGEGEEIKYGEDSVGAMM